MTTGCIRGVKTLETVTTAIEREPLNYELLAKNFAQIRAYVLKQSLVINQYKDYYESPKTDK